MIGMIGMIGMVGMVCVVGVVGMILTEYSVQTIKTLFADKLLTMSIIICTGPTASGKTSLYRVLQQAGPLVHLEWPVDNTTMEQPGNKFIECPANQLVAAVQSAKQCGDDVCVAVCVSHHHPAQPDIVLPGIQVVTLVRAEPSNIDEQTWTVQGETITSSSPGEVHELFGLADSHDA